MINVVKKKEDTGIKMKVIIAEEKGKLATETLYLNFWRCIQAYYKGFVNVSASRLSRVPHGIPHGECYPALAPSYPL